LDIEWLLIGIVPNRLDLQKRMDHGISVTRTVLNQSYQKRNTLMLCQLKNLTKVLWYMWYGQSGHQVILLATQHVVRSKHWLYSQILMMHVTLRNVSVPQSDANKNNYEFTASTCQLFKSDYTQWSGYFDSLDAVNINSIIIGASTK